MSKFAHGSEEEQELQVRKLRRGVKAFRLLARNAFETKGMAGLPKTSLSLLKAQVVLVDVGFPEASDLVLDSLNVS